MYKSILILPRHELNHPSCDWTQYVGPISDGQYSIARLNSEKLFVFLLSFFDTQKGILNQRVTHINDSYLSSGKINTIAQVSYHPKTNIATQMMPPKLSRLKSLNLFKEILYVVLLLFIRKKRTENK